MKPIMRTEEHFLQKHRKILNLKNREKIQIVFLGDSLTRRWEDNPELWDYFFAQYNCANFGVGGDCLENILWRIRNNELDGLNPLLFILLMGTNNLVKNSEEEIVNGIFEIVREIKKKCNDSFILLLGLLPREKDENGKACFNRIKEINNKLKEGMKEVWGAFMDIGMHFINANGEINKEIMPDGLHLNSEGYKILGPILKKEIEKILVTQ